MIVFVHRQQQQISLLKIVSNLVRKIDSRLCQSFGSTPLIQALTKLQLGATIALAIALACCCCFLLSFGAIWSGNCCQPIDHRRHRRHCLSLCCRHSKLHLPSLPRIPSRDSTRSGTELRLVGSAWNELTEQATEVHDCCCSNILVLDYRKLSSSSLSTQIHRQEKIQRVLSIMIRMSFMRTIVYFLIIRMLGRGFFDQVFNL